MIRTERIEQSPQRELVVHTAQRATAQADEASGVLEHCPERHPRLVGRPGLLPCVRVRTGQNPAQVRPAGSIFDEHRDVPPVLKVDLRSVDRPEPERARRHGELHRARHGVVIGQRKGVVAKLQGRRNELVWQRGAVEKGEGGVAVKLDVCGHEHMFASLAAERPPADDRQEQSAAPRSKVRSRNAGP